MDFWCGEHGILGVARILGGRGARPCVAWILKFGEFLVQISR